MKTTKVNKKPKRTPKPKKVNLTKLKAKAQNFFNIYIRTRDQLQDGTWKCISCGKIINHCNASHYAPVSLVQSLRFNENNVNASCIRCNMLEGNSIGYRKGLIEKIGIEEVEKIEDIAINHPNKTWNEEELLYIIEEYRNKIKNFNKNLTI